MSRLKIDVVAPPFAGHLHPILGLGQVLREFGEVRVLTTLDAAERVAAAGLAFQPILGGREKAVWGIPNTARPVRGRPWMLWRQFRENLNLLPGLRAEVEATWQAGRPDLAVVDFTLPSVGHWAQAMGIRWWTSHPSPLAIETPDGTPTYLGGWMPPGSMGGRIRDVLGRTCVRWFKRAVFAAVRRELNALGLGGVYRADGTEAVYSDEAILALGVRELEFPSSWPKAVRFVGPVYYTPEIAGVESPQLDATRRNVLVTIGTHLPYARAGLLQHVGAWAAAMPEVFFHYTTGGSDGAVEGELEGANWRVYRYVNYEREIGRFDAVIHHGGAGITYHCLRAGIPAVVWPQDYDQFDFAARLSYHGLAVRCGKAGAIPEALRRVPGDEAMRGRRAAFAQKLRESDLRTSLRRVLEERGFGSGGTD